MEIAGCNSVMVFRCMLSQCAKHRIVGRSIFTDWFAAFLTGVWCIWRWSRTIPVQPIDWGQKPSMIVFAYDSLRKLLLHQHWFLRAVISGSKFCGRRTDYFNVFVHFILNLFEFVIRSVVDALMQQLAVVNSFVILKRSARPFHETSILVSICHLSPLSRGICAVLKE